MSGSRVHLILEAIADVVREAGAHREVVVGLDAGQRPGGAPLPAAFIAATGETGSAEAIGETGSRSASLQVTTLQVSILTAVDAAGLADGSVSVREMHETAETARLALLGRVLDVPDAGLSRQPIRFLQSDLIEIDEGGRLWWQDILEVVYLQRAAA